VKSSGITADTNLGSLGLAIYFSPQRLNVFPFQNNPK